MADDIVTRLRQGDPYCLDGHIYRDWANEAADEIERLRKDLGQTAQLLVALGESLEDQYGF